MRVSIGDAGKHRTVRLAIGLDILRHVLQPQSRQASHADLLSASSQPPRLMGWPRSDPLPVPLWRRPGGCLWLCGVCSDACAPLAADFVASLPCADLQFFVNYLYRRAATTRGQPDWDHNGLRKGFITI